MKFNFVVILSYYSKQIIVCILLVIIIIIILINKHKLHVKHFYKKLYKDKNDIEKCFNKTKKVTCSRKSNELYIKNRKPNAYLLLLNEYSHNELDYPTIKDCEYLITIISEPEMFYERHVLRKIYKKYNFLSCVFITGKSNKSNINRKITKEISTHKDIVQFNFISSYYALELQTYNILLWSSKLHTHFKWLIKHDTDTFFNINVLRKLHLTYNRDEENKIWGYIIGFFPSGMGYVIPYKLINTLLNASSSEINSNCYGKPEDVFIGRLCRISKVSMCDIRKYNKKIGEGGIVIDSVDNFFMIHRLKPHEIFFLHHIYR